MNLHQYPTEELCEIYSNLDSWKWDIRVGDEPEGWHLLPRYNRRWYHRLLRRRTKADYINPVLNSIRSAVPEKELFRYHHLHTLGRSNEAFEEWWTPNGGFYSS